RDEVRKIEAITPTGSLSVPHALLRNAVEDERLTLAKNVFLFSFYVGGINFVDLAKLRWRNLTADSEGKQRLTYKRQKTGGKFSVRLLDPAFAIVEQYRPSTYNESDDYVFPILYRQQHQTPTQIHNRIHKVSAMVNADLKAVGQRAGIDTPLTTYVARHSFATSLRQAGIADAITGQMMGHKNASVTAIYLDSFPSEIVDSAYDALL
ncbi:MAG: integrase family protein, partial [Spirosoma sp.]|nr:integrase family protein [Spirosoma sp.]